MGVLKVAALVLLAPVAVSGCLAARTAVVSTGERYASRGAAQDIYLLGADDKIHITVFGEPQLSGDYSVGGDGALSFPLIGSVPVAGKTTEQASREIEVLLAGGYLKNPRVNLEVSTYRPFFILGEVKQPGQYPFVNGLTVLNAIATAQGFTPRAVKKYVFIRPFGEQTDQEYVLTPDLRIRPGDTVRLAERYF